MSPLYMAYAARALGKTTSELTDEEFHGIWTGELDEWIEMANTAQLTALTHLDPTDREDPPR
jgi:hypothetical protein